MPDLLYFGSALINRSIFVQKSNRFGCHSDIQYSMFDLLQSSLKKKNHDRFFSFMWLFLMWSHIYVYLGGFGLTGKKFAYHWLALLYMFLWNANYHWHILVKKLNIVYSDFVLFCLKYVFGLVIKFLLRQWWYDHEFFVSKMPILNFFIHP